VQASEMIVRAESFAKAVIQSVGLGSMVLVCPAIVIRLEGR